MDIKEVYKMYVKLPNNFKTTDLDNLIKEMIIIYYLIIIICKEFSFIIIYL